MFFTTTRALVLLAVCAIPTFAVQSASATASNYVEVHTNSGGNSVVHTNVSESSSASVDITTVINGETVIDIHEVSDGKPLVIETSHEGDDGSSATARVDLNTRSVSSTIRSGTPHEPVETADLLRATTLIAPPPIPKAHVSLPEQIVQPALPNEWAQPEVPAPPEELVQPALITKVIDATDEPHYVLDEESHDDPLVTRILRSFAHTLTYVFTIFF